jgi:hypothetical protein
MDNRGQWSDFCTPISHTITGSGIHQPPSPWSDATDEDPFVGWNPISPAVDANFSIERGAGLTFEGQASLRVELGSGTKAIISPLFNTTPLEKLSLQVSVQRGGTGATLTANAYIRYFEEDGTTQVGSDVLFYTTSLTTSFVTSPRVVETTPAGAYTYAFILSTTVTGTPVGALIGYWSYPKADRQVDETQIEDDSVSDVKVKSGLDATKLTHGTFDTSLIADGDIPPGKLGSGAVLPGDTNNGVPLLENGSLEIPNLAGTAPAGWDYNNSGTLVYNQAGTGASLDGKCSVTLGGGVGTHRLQGPKVPWAYGRRVGIDLSFWYILSTLTGTTVTFGLAQYDRTGAYIADAVANDPAGGTLSWAAGTATFQRGFRSQSALDLTTAYIAPYVKLVVASGTGTVEVDIFKLDEQGQTIYPSRVQGGSTTGGDTGPYIDLSGTTANIVSAGGVKVGSTSSVPILEMLGGPATLDFPSVAANSSSDLPITVTGAAVGDVVSLGLPAGSVLGNMLFMAWVSATDTVTVRCMNNGALALNPSSGSFKVLVTKL